MASTAAVAAGRKMVVALFDAKEYDKTHMLAAKGVEVIEWRFHEECLSAKNAEEAKGADAVCVFVNDLVDKDCLKVLSGLGIKAIALRCAGFDRVDIASAKEMGISVFRVPAYSPNAVAEHAVALTQTLNRKIHRAHVRVRGCDFSLGGLVGFDLNGKTVGMIGTGKIGQIAGKIFRGFDCTVVAYDPYQATQWAQDNNVTYKSLDELLAVSDVISLHLPLAPETHHLLNAEKLAKTKKGCLIVNTSRGPLIDTAALIAALKSGHVGGAALDTYEHEHGVFFRNLSNQVPQDEMLAQLLSFPNVLITAHQAFLTREALDEIARVTVSNLSAHFNKTELLKGTEL